MSDPHSTAQTQQNGFDPRTTASGDGPQAVYQAKVKGGELRADPVQAMAVEHLQALWQRLRAYDPPRHAPPRKGLFSRWLGGAQNPAADQTAPRGLYMVGDVGRGKSMLMDLFFDQAQVARKQRVHFHRFMQDVHARLHAWERAHPREEDPIPPLADETAAQAALLCFDEFQINDIADAMILGRLFQALFARGVVVVMTSNTAPQDLFKGQPGRDAFLPFIAILERHLEVLPLQGERDYRRARLHALRTWYVPADARADQALDEAFTDLAEGVPAQAETLEVMGRPFTVPLAAGGVARFDFQTLCGQPLGAGDYLALASRYHSLVLDGIPRLSPDNHDEARRFITLIDALYECRVKLVASAQTVPDKLYQEGEGARAFERTASRLEEMQSQTYLDLPHLA